MPLTFHRSKRSSTPLLRISLSTYITSLKYCFIAAKGGDITQAPSNIVKKVGQRIKLLCCCGEDLTWEKYIEAPSKSYTLSFGTTLGGRCGDDQCVLNTDDGNYELVVKSAVLGDGGRYRCKQQFKSTQHRDAEVIVFGKVHFKTLKLLSFTVTIIYIVDSVVAVQNDERSRTSKVSGSCQRLAVHGKE